MYYFICFLIFVSIFSWAAFRRKAFEKLQYPNVLEQIDYARMTEQCRRYSHQSVLEQIEQYQRHVAGAQCRR